MAYAPVFVTLFDDEAPDGFERVAAKKIDEQNVLLVPTTSEHYFLVNKEWCGKVVDIRMFPDDCWVVNRCVNPRVRRGCIIYKPTKVPDSLEQDEIKMLRAELEKCKKIIAEKDDTIRNYEYILAQYS